MKTNGGIDLGRKEKWMKQTGKLETSSKMYHILLYDTNTKTKLSLQVRLVNLC